MTSFAKTAGLAGILVAVFATVTPELTAAQLDHAVSEGQGVTTELGANAAAITYWVSGSDGWHVVTTVDTVIEQRRRKARRGALLVGASAWPIPVDLCSPCHRRATAGSTHPSARRPGRGCPGRRPRMMAMPQITPSQEGYEMKDSKTLLLNYLASVRDPERASSLFADDGVFELPFLPSLGVEPRYIGRREISALVHKLLEIYPNFAFAPDDTRILIETPEKTFAEYVGRGRVASTGRTAHHLFTGYLVAEAGRIKLLRESFNPLTMAQAQLPNGVADIGPPGDEVHSF